ncbi:unnamed protein product [Cylicocyclus nassatus]|uniref:Acetyl-CoA hydrolase n=1 Tax=Cylicocyclus nassatus TaxID=53992 RepID=A0AA36H8N5_CYLNA|nr:unnamed protein product [Cylicocyclus nassatus]
MRWNALLQRSIAPLSSRLSSPIVGKSPKKVTADEAVSQIKSNSTLYVHTQASTPTELLTSLCNRVENHQLSGLCVYHTLLGGEIPWSNEKFFGKIRSNSFFLDNTIRRLVNNGHADYIPMFLSDIPKYFRNGTLPLDFALISTTPPDRLGYCSIGVNVDTSLGPIESAKKIIAVTNKRMPRTFGITSIHQSHIDSIVEVDRDIYGTSEEASITEVKNKIGRLIADNLVEDGATLQLGIGAIPDSTLAAMKHHKNLGIHTELVGNGVVDLIERGVIDNSKKSVMPGKIVTSFAFGPKKFYDFVDNNPMFHFTCCSWTNDLDVIRANSKMTCVNSGIEIDLTGQVVSDSIGTTFYSGFGGQLDFMTAATTTNDGLGKAIIAITSRTNRGKSKITSTLAKGAGVVTTRGHVRLLTQTSGNN